MAADAETKSDLIVRNELLTEAHAILAETLLRGAIQLDIDPVEPLGQRIKSFDATLRGMGLVDRNLLLK